MQGKTQTDLVPVETIDKVPIAMFTGTIDEMCSHSHALEYAKKIGDAVVAVDAAAEVTVGKAEFKVSQESAKRDAC